MYKMLSSQLRGGLSFASQRYASASSHEVKNERQNQSPDKLNDVLIDIDANK